MISTLLGALSLQFFWKTLLHILFKVLLAYSGVLWEGYRDKVAAIFLLLIV